MVQQKDHINVVVCLAVLALLMAGCATAPHMQTGAVAGSALGGVVGGVVGHQSGHTAAGALIGAGTGALAGGIVGHSADVREADRLEAEYAEQLQMAVTNDDLIRLTQTGVSDQVILNTITTQGGRFDLTPDAIIFLKSNGVSDTVILAVQSAQTSATSPLRSSQTTILKPSPTRIVILPRALTLGVRVGPTAPRYIPRRRVRHTRHRRFW